MSEEVKKAFEKLRSVVEGDYVLSSDIMDLKNAVIALANYLKSHLKSIGVERKELDLAIREVELLNVKAGDITFADHRNRISKAILYLYEVYKKFPRKDSDSCSLVFEAGGFPTYATLYHNYSDSQFEDAPLYHNYSDPQFEDSKLYHNYSDTQFEDAVLYHGYSETTVTA